MSRAVRLEPAHDAAVYAVAQRFSATPFNINYADSDGEALAGCIRELLLRAGWIQLSAASPAPGFNRRGVILWAPPAMVGTAEALAVPLGEVFAVQVVERSDGGPVAVTVGLATWSTVRGVMPAS